jgi:Asp-tRNA(Asn)/Glu-tRNA(Gln) amidotransferase A subunit family amidase
VVKTPKWPLASEAQRAHFAENVTKLQDAGAKVREVSMPRMFDDAWENVMTIMCHDAVKSFASIESRHRIRLSPHLIEILDRGHSVTPDEYAAARAKRDNYRSWLDGVFDTHEAIATIPAAGEAPEGLSNTGDATFASLWTLAGLPAVTIPSGRGPKGLPLGFQVVGRYREDEQTLRAAAWCESALAFSPGLAGETIAPELARADAPGMSRLMALTTRRSSTQ